MTPEQKETLEYASRKISEGISYLLGNLPIQAYTNIEAGRIVIVELLEKTK